MTPVEDGLIEFRFGATYFRLPASDISTAKLLIDNILNAKMKPNVSEPKKDEPKLQADALQPPPDLLSLEQGVGTAGGKDISQ